MYPSWRAPRGKDVWIYHTASPRALHTRGFLHFVERNESVNEWINMDANQVEKKRYLTFPWEEERETLASHYRFSQSTRNRRILGTWTTQKSNLIFQDLCSLRKNIPVLSFCQESGNPLLPPKQPHFSVLAPVKHQQLQRFLLRTFQMPILLVVTVANIRSSK